MLKIYIILIAIFLLSSCKLTNFGKNIDLGKEAMKNEHYRAAIYYLELAKIDKPNHAGVNELLKVSNNKVKESLEKMKDPIPEIAVDSTGKRLSYREYRVAVLNELSIRESGVNKEGKTFENYIKDKELEAPSSQKLNYDQLFQNWRKNYDH
ncbi:hypothetical protein [Paenibacillus nuruki]|uniref:hypothetical protein n=1 Tax=Paenibacillus nuruki TaxID=1886670 RepID=UPI002804F1DF|nr:hypothetical protein [Paenibacillus nuruki]